MESGTFLSNSSITILASLDQSDYFVRRHLTECRTTMYLNHPRSEKEPPDWDTQSKARKCKSNGMMSMILFNRPSNTSSFTFARKMLKVMLPSA
eukprot:scaffold49562_cov52-Attheya_sp.AAC.3